MVPGITAKKNWVPMKLSPSIQGPANRAPGSDDIAVVDKKSAIPGLPSAVHRLPYYDSELNALKILSRISFTFPTPAIWKYLGAAASPDFSQPL